MSHRQLFAIGASCLLCLSGCGSSGPGRQPLRGAVTIDGVKLESGAISLRPVDGNSGSAAVTTVEYGYYRFTQENGPLPGSYAVKINIDPDSEQGKAILAAGVPPSVDAAAPLGPKGGSLTPTTLPRTQQNAVQPKLHWELHFTVSEVGASKNDFELSN